MDKKNMTHPRDEACAGYCRHCDEIHFLGEGNSRQHALELMKVLEEKKRIDLTVEDDQANPAFHTDHLWRDARGKMFGVLECLNEQGETIILKAFSGGQSHGVWNVDGWAPVLLDVDGYNELVWPIDAKIKELTATVLSLEKGSPEYCKKSFERKKICQQLMKDIHALYSAHNLSGEHLSLYDVFIHNDKNIPTGAGDCCATKLINEAARLKLKPIGISEFFWGRETRSGARHQGQFYHACKEKCQPMLGYMLCEKKAKA
ncbi:MAG: hypothetical protein HRT88_19320 [Lentisphaeraceae bacterium]|nr:hypothetical protein [Lentisphaeraceae bacterium]